MANKIFIDPISTINNYDGTSGYRLCQVVNAGEEFPIAEPFFWIDYAGEFQGNLNEFYYDPDDQSVKSIPIEPEQNIDALLDDLLLSESAQ